MNRFVIAFAFVAPLALLSSTANASSCPSGWDSKTKDGKTVCRSKPVDDGVTCKDGFKLVIDAVGRDKCKNLANPSVEANATCPKGQLSYGSHFGMAPD